MHVCKISSSINSSNSYYITFSYTYTPTESESVNNISISDIHINDIVNYIRLKYILDKKPYIVEYDNIEYEIIKSISNITKTTEMDITSMKVTTITGTYKLMLNKLNGKLQTLPANTESEITIFFKKEIDDPSLMVVK